MVAPKSHTLRNTRRFFSQRSRCVTLFFFLVLVVVVIHFYDESSIVLSDPALFTPFMEDAIRIPVTPLHSTTTTIAKSKPNTTNVLSSSVTIRQGSSKSSRIQLRDQDEATIKNQKRDISPVTVLYEKDFVKDYSKQKEFEATFFDSSPACTPVNQVSFTLVTQASMDRIWIMKHHCERWPPPHPISIAIFLPPDSPYNETHVAEELDFHLGCDLSRMKVIVMKGNSPMEKYPVNLLRNLAIRSATTTHVVYTDSDFLISDGLYQDLMAMAPTIAKDPLAAIVLPAFVYHSGCQEKFSSENQEALSCLANEWETGVPKTKDDLIPLWEKPRRILPNVKSGFHGVHYHGSTKYDEFKNQTAPLQIPCISHWLYEPYLAIRLCEDLPEFPEVFRGYGWNKNVWIMWLTKKRNYSLWQTPRGFVLHLPHEVSVSWRNFKKPAKTKHKMRKSPLEQELYLEWFKKKVPRHPDRIPSCSDLKKLESLRSGPK